MAYIREYLHPPPPPQASLALAPHADVLGASSRVDVIQFIFLCFCHDLKYIITALQYVVVKHSTSSPGRLSQGKVPWGRGCQAFYVIYRCLCIWTVTILIFDGLLTLTTEFQDEATLFEVSMKISQ